MLRSELSRIVRGKAHRDAAVDLIGCEVYELMNHIELQFLDGMNWDNRSEWHIDHIIPCALFDLSDIEEQKACFNWENLQPLWAYDNLSKSSSLTRATFEEHKHRLPKSFVDRTEAKFIGRTIIRR